MFYVESVIVDVLHTLVAEEAARDVELLATDNDDLLTVQSLLGNDGSETTKKMALAVNDDHLLQRGQYLGWYKT